jgi:hypothetical protein
MKYRYNMEIHNLGIVHLEDSKSKGIPSNTYSLGLGNIQYYNFDKKFS